MDATQELADRLRQAALFTLLGEEELTTLARRCRPVQLERDEVLFLRGEPARGFGEPKRRAWHGAAVPSAAPIGDRAWRDQAEGGGEEALFCSATEKRIILRFIQRTASMSMMASKRSKMPYLLLPPRRGRLATGTSTTR